MFATDDGRAHLIVLYLRNVLLFGTHVCEVFCDRCGLSCEICKSYAPCRVWGKKGVGDKGRGSVPMVWGIGT